MNIYESNCNDFENNGLGFLPNLISAKVTEEINGSYSLNFEYPVNGNNEEYIVENNIVKCDTARRKGQLFKIVKIEKSFEKLSVFCNHIFYNLRDNYIDDTAPTNKAPEDFGNWILSKTNYDHPFKVYSTLNNIKSARYVGKNPAECFIGDLDNSVVNLFNAEIDRDNFNINIVDRIGHDNHVKLQIGKNITGIKVTTDTSDMYTRLHPVGYDGLELPEKFVDSPLVNLYPTPKIGRLEFSDIKYDPESEDAYNDIEDAYVALRNQCQSFYANNGDKPSINIKIDWLELSKTEEYKNKYSFIETVNLGDTITANLLGLDYETRVIKVVYNVLADMIETFEVGSTKASLASTINSYNKKIEEVSPESILSQAQKNATKQLISAMGGYIYKTQNELFIMDTDDPKTAVKIWRWNLNGLGYSKNGINGPYETAITQDGQIVADFITTGKLNTSLIEGYEDLILNVQSVQNLIKEVSNKNFITISNAYESDLVRLSIIGEMSLLYPEDELWPSEDLYPLDSYLIIQKENGEKRKVHLPINYLRFLNDEVFDEFLIENKTAKIIRRVGIDANGTPYELDEEIIEEYGTLKIPLYNDDRKMWLESFYDYPLIYNIKYAMQSDLTNVFATKVEMNAAITMKADEINLSVSRSIKAVNDDIDETNGRVNQKVDQDKIISSINLSPEEIKLQSNRISLEGIVTANENFKVLEDGSIEAKNGTFSGDVKLNGELLIGGNGILSTIIVQAATFSYSFAGAMGYTPLGFEAVDDKGVAIEDVFDFIIPDNYVVRKAYIYLKHIPMSMTSYFDSTAETITGYARNIKAFYATNDNSLYRYYDFSKAAPVGIEGSYSEISNCFGANGFTGSSSGMTSTKSIDISSYIKTGANSIKLYSTMTTPSGLKTIYSCTGCVMATLVITGYEKI